MTREEILHLLESGISRHDIASELQRTLLISSLEEAVAIIEAVEARAKAEENIWEVGA